jgi:hypothetical protein
MPAVKRSMKRFLPGAVVALLIVQFVLAAGTHIDVSKIIDKAEAESLLGQKIKDLTPVNAEGTDGYYSKCSYYSVIPGKSLVIRVQQHDANAMNPYKELDLLAASNGPMNLVKDLGDEAQMFAEGGESGAASRVLMLYVVKGNAFLVIGVSGFADDAVALEKAETVAKKILEHL